METADQAALQIAKAYGVPMSMVDGRPWVPTEEEAFVGATTYGALVRLRLAFRGLGLALLDEFVRFLRWARLV